MSTFAGKDLCSYLDQICGGRTKSTSVICPPGPNLLALSVPPPDQIRGQTDFTVTPGQNNEFSVGMVNRTVGRILNVCVVNVGSSSAQ